MRSPLGSLPTPAEALDAPDWPASGGFDTQPGERPRVHAPQRGGEVLEAEAPKKQPPARREETAPVESKPSGIAAFFGFATKPQNESDTAESKPSRKGWWQRPGDK